MQKSISNWGYPKSLMVDGIEYGIKSDYRAVINIFIALNDYELQNEDDYVKSSVILSLFYENYKNIPMQHWQEALDAMKEFIDMGISGDSGNNTRLIDWDKDAPIIISEVNNVLNKEIRAEKYMHWWTFLSAYMSIGESLLSNVLHIRIKKAKGQKLEKHEQEFYKNNKAIIELNKKDVRSEKEKNELRAYFGYKK